MKTDTIVLIIILIFLLMPSTKNSVVADNKYERMTNEGIVAVQASMSNFTETPTPTPNPDSSNCPCKGTKKEVSGDGLHSFPCRCGSNCNCAKKQDVMPEVTNFAEDIKKEEVEDIKKQTLYFTADWCSFCHLFDKNEVPTLEKYNWVVSSDKKAHIRKIDITKDGENNIYYIKYGKKRELPLFVHIENNKEKNSHVGYASATIVSNMWYK